MPAKPCNFKDAIILVVDDQQANLDLIETIFLDEGYTNFRCTNESREALRLFEENRPDIILLDLHMPGLDGFGVMEQLKSRIPPQEYLPFLILTADASTAVKERALSEGAHDFVTKPLDITEVLLRINNLLGTRLLHLQLHGQNQWLEQRVNERTAELMRANAAISQRNQDLQHAQLEMLERLATAAEFRDDDTGRHTRRVGYTSALLARTLGLRNDEVECYLRAAPLHDVGKIGVPDHILLKHGPLTDEEFTVIKTHIVIGANILGGSDSPLLQLAEQIALHHHEHWDGAGYTGLKGEMIPLSGRIVAVADVFDALTHERPYKVAWSIEDAVAEIQNQSGKQFDPGVVGAFLSLPHETLV